MSERFPRAMVEVVYAFDAYHSLPESKHPGAGEKHKHSYWITIGYHHERNGPFTWDRVESPQPRENGSVPDRDDFRMHVGIGWEF